MFGASSVRLVDCGGDVSFSLADLPELGAEGYRISISTDSVKVVAHSARGAYWATRTLLQLFDASESKRSLDCGEIEDVPKYRVRGAMLDVARRFCTMDFLRQQVKILSYYKFNEFHLHLNDNAGKDYSAFRMECDTFPGLTAADGHYGKAEFRKFVLESAEIGVNIVPEIDAPAHSRAFIKFNPSFKSEKYGDTHLDLHNPEILPFFKRLFAEYLSGNEPVFAGPDFSVGTDEYDKAEAEPFRAFTDSMFRIVKSLGKRPRAWGALTHATGATPVMSDGVTLDIWHNGYHRPEQALAEGFNLICIPDNLLYIVPKAGYYYDFLNCRRLYEKWEPSQFEDVYVPPSSPQLAGGKFALWNDIHDNGITDRELFDRLYPAYQTLSQKMWSGFVAGESWSSFQRIAANTREAPGVEVIHRGKRLYMLIDLSDGSVEWIDSAPAAGWDFREKTEVLVLRRIEMADGIRYIGVFETTQAQWEKLLGDNPSFFPSPDHPVEHISYLDALGFVRALERKTGLSGFDVPTGAEWEFAARAGADKEPEPIPETVCHRPVGAGLPNAFGLYDCLGNAAEWTSDLWDGHSDIRLLRGGAWNSPVDQRTFAYARPSRETSVSASYAEGVRVICRL